MSDVSPSRDRRWAIVMAALGAVIVAILAGIWWWSGASAPVSAPAMTASPASSPASAPSQGEAASKALEALETDPASLLPSELAGEIEGDVGEAIPVGTKVDSEPDTWEPSTAGGGVIEATLTFPDGSSERVGVVMIEEDEGWKVLQTVALEGTQ